MKRTFETEQEWRQFCDTSMYCVCGKLMTGFHMMNCARVRKIDERFGTVAGAQRKTESGGYA